LKEVSIVKELRWKKWTKGNSWDQEVEMVYQNRAR